MLSRLESLARQWASEKEGRDKEDYIPEMPPIKSAGYLRDCLFEIGPAMGTEQITWGEIDSWCNRTHEDLAPWAARALRRLSLEYLSASEAARKCDAKAPWLAPDSKPGKTALQLSIINFAKL